MRSNPITILVVAGVALLFMAVGLVSQGAALFAVLALALVGGWGALIFCHYRYLRQEELRQLLASTVQGQQPLGPVLWAYVRDRPKQELRLFYTALLLFVFPPAYAYYWFWHRWHSYDRKVERLAQLLDSGCPLSFALAGVAGVASRSTILAAALGESTGRLEHCLREAPRFRVAPLWLEAWPRLLYPVLVLLFLVGAVTFQMIFVVPKLEKIYADFNLRLPDLTQTFMEMSRWLMEYGWLLGFVLAGVLLLGALLALEPWVTWYFPVVSYFYRRYTQAHVLRLVALLLETELPVPHALGLLEDSGFFTGPARRALRRVRLGVMQGEPLGEQLYRAGLLPRAMLPLVQAAQRANNLPWALTELGNHLGQRTLRLAHRLATAIGPAVLVGVGVMVALVATGLFLCLVELILSQA